MQTHQLYSFLRFSCVLYCQHLLDVLLGFYRQVHYFKFILIFKGFIFILLRVCVCACVCLVMYMSACAQGIPEECVWSARAGVTGVCKSPDVGAENSV